MVEVKGVRDGKNQNAICAGIPATNDRVGARGQDADGAIARVWLHGETIANWVGHAAIDEGKPLAGKEGPSSAEKQELVRLQRENRQLRMERDILAKATAWFAAKKDGTSTPSSNS